MALIWNRLIKIGPVLYLTDTGLVGGDKLITTVSGLDQLRTSRAGSLTLAADGTPYAFNITNIGAGVEISISAERIPSSLLSSVISEINTSMVADSNLVVIFSGGPEGTLSVDCKCGTPNAEPITYDDMINTLVTNATINFTVVEIN